MRDYEAQYPNLLDRAQAERIGLTAQLERPMKQAERASQSRVAHGTPHDELRHSANFCRTLSVHGSSISSLILSEASA